MDGWVMGDIRLDAIGKLLAGVGAAYVEVAILPGETRLHQTVANRRNIARGLGRGLLEPPTLIATAEGGDLESEVLSDKLSPKIAHSNEVARDEFVQAINRSR